MAKSGFSASELVATAMIAQAVDEYQFGNQSFETIRNDIYSLIVGEQDYRLAKHVKTAGKSFILGQIEKEVRKRWR